MSTKQPFGPYDVTQGGIAGIVQDPTPPTATATSGATEPAWPTVEYDTVVDGGITWTAILARVSTGQVTSKLNQVLFQHDKVSYPDHYWQYGSLKWLTGANAGLSVSIQDSLGVGVNGNLIPYILCLEVMPNNIVSGDQFEATVGCAKIRSACQNFNNLDNHRAFPDMPTEDRALSTPNMSAQGYSQSMLKGAPN